MPNKSGALKKILTDFDGVWTDVREQARFVERARLDEISIKSGWKVADVEQCLEKVKKTVFQKPHLFGWMSHGRISAFSDEDPFLAHNAIVEAIGVLAENGVGRCALLCRDLKENGISSLSDMGEDIFRSGCKRYLSEKGGHKILSAARTCFGQISKEASLVVCTNFAEENVRGTLEKEGCVLQSHSSIKGITLRGFAKKNELTKDTPKTAHFGERAVSVDRNYYLEALCQEVPDVVVGDVFSLDLALPLWLAKNDRRFQKLTCVLLENYYTPHWARSLCDEPDFPQLIAIQSISELETIVFG